MYLTNTIYFYRKNEKYKILQCCAHFYVQFKGKKYIFCHRHTTPTYYVVPLDTNLNTI